MIMSVWFLSLWNSLSASKVLRRYSVGSVSGLVSIFCLSVLMLFTQHLQGDDRGQGHFETEVRRAVRWQMQNYPKSRLTDLYKNFFQDKFGPGHMVKDTASAGAYLRRELAQVKGKSQVQMAEKTGWEGRFLRIDLGIIKLRMVSYSDFFDAFVRSVSNAPEPDIESWRDEWKKIEKIIHTLYPHLLYFKEDSGEIDKLLSNGEYVVHHSEIYIKNYNPHYRLMEASIFQELMGNVTDGFGI